MRQNLLRLGALLGLAVALAVVGAHPTAERATASAARLGPADPPVTPNAGSVTATVTWDGTPVSQASTPATAFSLGPGQQATVNFTFASSGGAPAVATVQLVLLYLGVTLSSEGLPTSPPSPSAALNWSFGSLTSLTVGVYELDAHLLDAGGSVLWTEAFYVDAKAPYVVLSAIVGFALILGAAEIYWIATALRSRRLRRLTSVATTTGGSGAVLGLVTVLLLQQFGLLALSEVLPSSVYFAGAILAGGIVFGAAGYAVQHRR